LSVWRRAAAERMPPANVGENSNVELARVEHSYVIAER
jgi:hypothetical protein